MRKGAEKFVGKAFETLTKKTNADQHPLSHGDFSSRIYISDIPLHAIEANPHQPRTFFDEEKLNELAKSIAAQGVIKPIIVQEIEEGKRYRLIAGERRWRASRVAGKTKIPAIIRHHDKKEQLLIGLIENIQREDLTPAEECTAFGKLLNEGMTQTEIAESTGKDLSHISRCAKIARFLGEYLQKYKTIDIRMSNGSAVGLENLLQVSSQESYEAGEKLLKDIIKGNLTVKEVRTFTKNKDTRNKESSISKPLPSWLKQVQKTFSTPFSTTITEKDRKKNIDKELDTTIQTISTILEELKVIKRTLERGEQ